jgi:hypothetical protein
MSRRLFAFLLSELKTVRLACQKCGGIAEVTLEQLSEMEAGCRLCGTDFLPPESNAPIQQVIKNPYALIARAILAARDRKEKVEVEFILPDQS